MNRSSKLAIGLVASAFLAGAITISLVSGRTGTGFLWKDEDSLEKQAEANLGNVTFDTCKSYGPLTACNTTDGGICQKNGRVPWQCSYPGGGSRRRIRNLLTYANGGAESTPVDVFEYHYWTTGQAIKVLS